MRQDGPAKLDIKIKSDWLLICFTFVTNHLEVLNFLISNCTSRNTNFTFQFLLPRSISLIQVPLTVVSQSTLMKILNSK